MQRDDFISGTVRPDEPCPTGMRQIDPVAHKCTPAMQCMVCDGYHLETKNEVLEIQKDREILQLADQVLPEIAKGAEDLPAGKALLLARCLAKWAHNKGCRP